MFIIPYIYHNLFNLSFNFYNSITFYVFISPIIFVITIKNIFIIICVYHNGTNLPFISAYLLFFECLFFFYYCCLKYWKYIYVYQNLNGYIANIKNLFQIFFGIITLNLVSIFLAYKVSKYIFQISFVPHPWKQF